LHAITKDISKNIYQVPMLVNGCQEDLTSEEHSFSLRILMKKKRLQQQKDLSRVKTLLILKRPKEVETMKWYYYVIIFVVFTILGGVITDIVDTKKIQQSAETAIVEETQQVEENQTSENWTLEMNPILLKSVEHECLGFLGSRTNQNDSALYFRNVGLDVIPYLVKIANFKEGGNLTKSEKGARVALMYVFEYRIKKTNDVLKKRILAGDLKGVDISDIFTETFGFQTKLGILDEQPSWVTGYPLLPVESFVDDDMEMFIEYGHSCSKQCNRHRR